MVDIDTIIKAYKFCKNNEGTCDKCSYFPKRSKLYGCPINNDMISAISEQKAEIDRLKAEQPKWISVSERMPDNANKPGAFCPKLRVLTPWGETYGWFNPDRGRWFFVDWFLYGDVRDFERGDIAKISQTPKGSSVITHWMPITKAGEQDGN